MRLEGEVCVVTGAAGGQGRAVASRFAEEGASVLLLDTDITRGAEAASQIRNRGLSADFLACDVSEEGDWLRVRSHLEQTLGPCTVLYNNAAIFLPEDRSVLDIEVSTWDRVMAVNVRGIFLGCKHLIPGMIERGGGSVVNIASIRASIGATTPQDAYSASKGAVVSLSKAMAIEFAHHAVRVNVISPGTILTEMAPVKDPVLAAERLKRYPLGRFGTTDDIASAAVYLASRESGWTTGIELMIDGGTSTFYV